MDRRDTSIHVECRCEDRSCQKELGLSSLQRIAAVGLDATSRPLAHVCVCMRACAHNGVNLPERGRGSRVARVTYCRARFTRDALDKFLVPFEFSDSSRIANDTRYSSPPPPPPLVSKSDTFFRGTLSGKMLYFNDLEINFLGRVNCTKLIIC